MRTADERGLLERRATRLRAPPVEEEQDASILLAEFPVGGDRYAIPLDALRVALPLRLVRPVPLSPPHIVGIFRYEGRILTALSLAAILGVRGWRQDPSVLLVMTGPGGQLTAVDCEAIPRPLTLPRAALDHARAQAPSAPLLDVIAGDSGVVRIAVDLHRLLERAEVSVDR